MSRTLLLMLVVASAAHAKPWNGIDPGASSELDVIGKFGEPAKRLTQGAFDVLVYAKQNAISGTVQAQFKVDPTTKVVKRIDVYPLPIIDAAAIEKTYGPACAGNSLDGCYVRKQSASKHPYYVYALLGLAIFFKDDGITVQSFAFLPTPGAPKPKPPSEEPASDDEQP